MFEDRSLKIDLCALALLALVAFLGVVAVDVRRDRSAEHDRLAAERRRSQRLRPGRRAHVALSVRKPRHRGVLSGRLARRCSRSSCCGAARSINRSCGRWAGRSRSPGSRRSPRSRFRIGRLARSSAPAATSARWAAACWNRTSPIAGAYIFTLSVLLAGLLLSTDYFLFRAAAVTTRSPAGR